MQTRPVARFIPQAAVRWYPMVAMGARRQPAALLPQLGQGQGVALAVGREHQPEDE